ncbi:MAG TPA: hypothetical protein VEC57_18960 [Candidatus Limnocylindrales bacterium]|nr:hypothetical protein [Candidatus Limnocylindrales bacterium]
MAAFVVLASLVLSMEMDTDIRTSLATASFALATLVSVVGVPAVPADAPSRSGTLS